MLKTFITSFKLQNTYIKSIYIIAYKQNIIKNSKNDEAKERFFDADLGKLWHCYA